MQTEPLFTATDALTELVGFFAAFVATGSVGFRYAILRRLESEPVLRRQAVKRSASSGLIGALVTLFMFVTISLSTAAARQHTNVAQLVMSNGQSATQLLLTAAAVVGLAMALARIEAGWLIAAVGVILGPLTPVFFGRWDRWANPVHKLAGGLWIGTLFILVVAGLGSVLASDLEPLRRGALAAAMVNAFSPLALAAAVILSVSGLTTAWTHLKVLSNLWTTPYGYALIAKLCVVAIVAGLGAWNWRRQKPLLGTHEAAGVLRRSAVAELAAATIVLVITSILVSLPSPKAPGDAQHASIQPQSLSDLSLIPPPARQTQDAYWSQQQRRPTWQTDTDSKNGWQRSSACSSSSRS
jgi:putative copper resistance protein D